MISRRIGRFAGDRRLALLLIAAADVAAKVAGIAEHRIQNALVPFARRVFEQLIKRQRRIDLKRSWRGRAAPGNMGAIQHRVILVHGRIGLFTAQHKAG